MIKSYCMDNEIFEKYFQFLRVITKNINEHFENQKEYICCREGCSHCCENGDYPCSNLEFECLQLGFYPVDAETKNIVQQNINKLKEEKANFSGKKFMHRCPFLVNNRCCVYNFRPIICRTFGLAYVEMKDDGKTISSLKIPFCVNMGLNYSEVYDKEKNALSSVLYKQKGYNTEPVAFNLDTRTLIQKVGHDMLDLDFGDIKPLIDWL